jgi:hypothetical protein
MVTLLHDLFTEQRLASELPHENDHHMEEKVRQYNQVNLLDALEDHGFCELITSLLEFHDSLDTMEKTVHAMNTFFDLCSKQFKQISQQLRRASNKLKAVSQQEEEHSADAYFHSLHLMVESMIERVEPQTKRVEL